MISPFRVLEIPQGLNQSPAIQQLLPGLRIDENAILERLLAYKLDCNIEKEQMEEFSKYAHSPAHLAVARRDYVALRSIITTLPRLAKAGEVNTEEESIAEELQAEAVSAVIDRRDVPGRETPLHLAVRLCDPIAADILMSAGADWSLQNECGWSALQEAVCNREDAIAMIIARHYQPLAWAKWCRRLPRIVASAARLRDFYMEMTFHFESSVIPFIARIAPSDTYRIWKRGSNLRADMTLAGFDNFRIQRSDQTFLFLGEGYSSDDKLITLPPGALIVLSHKEKEITNALEGAGAQPTDAEVAHEVELMSRTNMYRPGIDVTQAELVPNLNWRRQERTEMIGNWKAKIYDMLHVMVNVKSRRVPGAMTDEELFSADGEDRLAHVGGNDEYDDVLTVEERKQLGVQLNPALRRGNSDTHLEREERGVNDNPESGSIASCDNLESNGITKERKSWFGWNKKNARTNSELDDLKMSKKLSKLTSEGSNHKVKVRERSKSFDFSFDEMEDNTKKGKDKNSKKKKNKEASSESKNESEYKKSLRPVLWLTQDFPLKTNELLPLLDILANKVKAIRRLRELLTIKFPHGTFPVKVAIPIVPTIRVHVTFTKFEELQPVEEFTTPPSSPDHFQDAKAKESEGSSSSWMKGSRGGQSSDGDGHKDEVDPFHIPPDYIWVTANEKKRRKKEKKDKSKKHRKHACAKGGSTTPQVREEMEE